MLLKHDNDEKPLFELHTHPYSVKEGNYKGVAFSAADISHLAYSLQMGAKGGYASFVETGTKRFALVIKDTDKAKAFFKANNPKMIQEKWDKAYKNASGTF